jgi:hypothetical protein
VLVIAHAHPLKEIPVASNDVHRLNLGDVHRPIKRCLERWTLQHLQPDERFVLQRPGLQGFADWGLASST